MTIPARTVRALRDARRRLRDVAAAEHSLTSMAAVRASDEAGAADDAVTTTISQASHVLAMARSTADLDRVFDVIADDRAMAARARASAVSASAAASGSAQRLAGRERQLRSMEKLIERLDQDRAKDEAKEDQVLADDRACRQRQR